VVYDMGGGARSEGSMELLNVIPPLSLHSNRLNTGENVRDTITIAIR